MRLLCLLIFAHAAMGQQVVPINWKAFKRIGITGSNAVKERKILLNANRYAQTTWYEKYATQTSAYIDFGGIGEHHTRGAACQAFALAVSHQTLHLPGKERTIRLISSLAYRHKANCVGGWGDHWQSAFWTAFAGAAAWLLWSDLPATDQLHVQGMVEQEANRFNDYKVPYLRDRNGAFVKDSGDSKMEENSWNALVLQLAIAMMPQHANRSTWMNKNIELVLSSMARPEDVTNTRVFHGKPLNAWLDGSNLNSDGTVTNHGFIHPDYMSCTVHNFFNALVFGLAGEAIPQAVLFNTDLVYKAMVDLPFAAPPYVAPGGTIYMPGSDSIYYPRNTDWGRSRRMSFATMDCQAAIFRLDSLASRKGAYWEALHAQQVLNLQQRSTDGRTYQGANEDSYKGREEWVACHAAMAWLTHWLAAQKRFRFTNQAY